MKNLVEKIEEYEKNGWEYVTNYRTENHILKQALVKGENIKEITNGNIVDYK